MAGINQNPYGGDEENKLTRAEMIKLQSDDHGNVVNDQWAAYTRARDAGHLEYVKDARKFDEYYYGKQWDSDVKATLDAQGRPTNTYNLVLSTVNAVVGEYIRSRQDIAFRPSGKGANPESANALRFLFKQIALNNKSEHKEKTVFLDGLIQDRGFFYYSLDFSDSIDGEVREEVLDPTDVILDPGAKEYDPETWSEVFVSRWLTPDQIGALYGAEFKDMVDLVAVNGTFGHDSIEWEAPNFSGDHYTSEVFYQSSDEELRRVKRIRVIERQYKKLTRTAYFVDKRTGDMRPVPSAWDKKRSADFAARMNLLIIWKPERRVRVTITADRILLHDDWSLFSKISVVPFFPYFRRGRPFGMVRNLIDPQNLLNKITAQELHVVNTTANSGWIFESGSLVNMDRDDLKQQGSSTGLVLEYAQGREAPEKIQPNQIPTGLSEISSKASLFFREISGVSAAQLGTERSDSSKALEARRAGGLIQQDVIFDNLDFTRKLRAELMLEMVQSYYTETRLIQIFEKNEDGDDVQVEMEVNQPYEILDEESMEAVEQIKNDLTLGEYCVVITNVPRRDSYDESVFDQAMQMREQGVAIPDFVLIENSNIPDKKELVEISKQIQGLAAPTPEEVERAQMLDELQMRALAAEVMEKEAQAMERMANAERYRAQAGEAAARPQVEQAKAGLAARVQLEEAALQHQTNQEDLFVRLQLMKDKNASAERIAQINSMTKRSDTALKRVTELQKATIAADAKSKAAAGKRSPSKKK